MSKGLGPLPEARKPDRNGAGWFTAGQMHAYAAEQVAAERERWIEAVMAELDGNGQALAIVAYATRA